MADKSITMYKDERSIQIDPKLYKGAIAKGWSRTKPPAKAASPAPSPTGAPAGGGGGAPSAGQGGGGASPHAGMYGPGTLDALKQVGPGQAFMRGLNPFHSAPEGLPQRPGPAGTAMAAGADMANLREMAGMREAGNWAGWGGMAAGTAVGFLGPEMLKGGVKTLKGAKETAQAARAAKRAASIQKEIKGGVGAARAAAEYTQPIIDGLNRSYESMHKVLDKEVLKPNNRLKQLGNLMDMSNEPIIDKLGQDLVRMTRQVQGGAQTLIKYGEAHALHRNIQEILKNVPKYKIEKWEPILKELDAELEAGKQGVAQARGLGKEWEEMGQLWKQANDLAKGIAARMESPSGTVGKAMRDVGIQRMPEGASSQGKALAKKVGTKVGPKPGMNVGRAVGRTIQGGTAAYRGGASVANSEGGGDAF